MAYVAFYLCRKNLSIILPVFAREHLYSNTQSSHIVLLFSVAYCVGQFVMGMLTDRFGGRRVVVGGMTLSACVTAAMGLSSSYEELLVLQTINGFAQAAGWVGLMKIMKQYPARRRGVVMGWWSTNYVAGGFVATLLATYALQASWLVGSSWKRAAWIPATGLLLYAMIFLLVTRDRADAPAVGRVVVRQTYFEVVMMALTSARVRVLMCSYFFVKLIRYSLLFWLPLYLASYLLMTPVRAGYTSSRLEAFGVAGVLAAGYVSEYVFRARRFPVAMLFLVLLCVGCVATSRLNPGSSRIEIVLLLSLMGFAVYGADTLLVGAGAQDASSPEHMGTIAGMVDGAGSVGQVLSPLFVAYISGRWGWPTVFQVLAVIAIACAGVLGLGLAAEKEPVEV